MRKTVLAAAALAVMLSIGASVDRAQAMTGVTPTELGLSTSNSGLVQNAALVCGRWGCGGSGWRLVAASMHLPAPLGVGVGVVPVGVGAVPGGIGKPVTIERWSMI